MRLAESYLGNDNKSPTEVGKTQNSDSVRWGGKSPKYLLNFEIIKEAYLQSKSWLTSKSKV